MRLLRLAPLFALAMLTFSATLLAGSRQIVISERLNQAYGAELLSVPLNAADGECVVDGVSMVGPSGPVAVQLSDVELWPGDGGHVKSARVWFISAPLEPLTSATFTLSWGTTPVPAVKTDLTVEHGETKAGPNDYLNVSTAALKVTLPVTNGPSSALPGLPLLSLSFGGGKAVSSGALALGEEPVAWQAKLLATGPVFAQVRTVYRHADGVTTTVMATVVAGDNTVRWETTASADKPGQYIDLRLPVAAGVAKAVLPKGYGMWARDREAAITPGPEPVVWLSPDSSVVNIFADSPPHVRFPGAEGGLELVLQSRDPAYWVVPPEPLTYAGFPDWQLEQIPLMWEAWKRNRIPVSYSADGYVSLRLPVIAGGRRFLTSAGDPLIGDRLDTVKDMVLDWPADPAVTRPGLWVDTARVAAIQQRAATDELAATLLKARQRYAASFALPLLTQAAGDRDPKAVEETVERLRAGLGQMGNFDVMRGAISLATHYDALIASDMISADDRALFRAQLAYLGYLMADAQCWSMERGYLSGNPNMSVSYTLSLGIIAAVLRDHPESATWLAYTEAWMDAWLDREVGANGEWLPEGGHYQYVSIDTITIYAIAMTHAGVRDYSADPRLKRLLIYCAKYHTPRDSNRAGKRAISTYGRGHGGFQPLFGVAAAFYAPTDPALSATFQWLWHESGNPVYLPDGRLGGTEPYYMDTTLPAAEPSWGSESFPQLGVVLRHGFATPNESFVNALTATSSTRNLDIWTPEIGGIAQWFGRGQPLSMSFTYEVGYKERHELLRNGVRLARNWGTEADAPVPFGYYTTTAVEGLALLPTTDYARSTFVHTKPDDRNWLPNPPIPAFPTVTAATDHTLTWTRQLLLVKDPAATGPAWLMLRDTTAGGQPTAWQFWTLSEVIGTPEQMRDTAAALAEPPGKTVHPARELPAGNRYTALGQHGVDVEYFIASPTDTPRHTLRYGGTWAGNHIPEYQDLLMLQLPGDGAYSVAVYPRPRDEAAPTFSSHADGQIIKAVTPTGTDYAFLSTAKATASAEGFAASGTAATVHVRGDTTTISLVAAGSVAWQKHSVAAELPVALRVTAKTLTLTLPADHTGTTVVLQSPGNWTLAAPAAGLTLDAKKGAIELTIPAGTSRIELQAK